jgi:hypothetical protein
LELGVSLELGAWCLVLSLNEDQEQECASPSLNFWNELRNPQGHLRPLATASGTGQPRTQPRNVPGVVRLFLFAIFLWRALTTADEFPSRELQVLTIALDLLCLIGLIAMRVQLSSKGPKDHSEQLMGEVLFWIALMAGLGLFAIRLNGNASWWTGHLHYDIGPRR